MNQMLVEEMTIAAEFGPRLRAAREAMKWNIGDLASITSSTSFDLINMENGVTPPTLDMLQALARHGIDINQLLIG